MVIALTIFFGLGFVAGLVAGAVGVWMAIVFAASKRNRRSGTASQILR